VAKFARTMIILECMVPEEWASTDGKQIVIAEMEKLFRTNGSAIGPANTMLHAIFIRTESGDLLLPAIEKMRKEYPLEPERPADACDNQGLCPECKAETERPEDTVRRYAQQLYHLQQWLMDNDPKRGDYTEAEVVPRVIELLECQSRQMIKRVTGYGAAMARGEYGRAAKLFAEICKSEGEVGDGEGSKA
jgi:hypothetical protein